MGSLWGMLEKFSLYGWDKRVVRLLLESMLCVLGRDILYFLVVFCWVRVGYLMYLCYYLSIRLVFKLRN